LESLHKQHPSNAFLGDITEKGEKVWARRKKSKRKTVLFSPNLIFELLEAEDERQNQD
jgi:hypothetical protein